ncbi:nickel pincer cofactor biosynthesis protein LarB [Chloroflexota bacterium]
MNPEHLRELLEKVREGNMDIEAALAQLKGFPYEERGFAKVDHYRSLRKGFPEVVFCQGKTEEQVTEIIGCLSRSESTVLATKASPEVFTAVQKVIPEAHYHHMARLIVVEKEGKKKGVGSILVVTAGTGDIPVAEEAAITAEAMGNSVERLYDVGVAGLHRLLDHERELSEAKVIIVIAGMEGALASVVGGLVDKPVIAVPTSVGYGASFEGLAALLGMLNTCAPGVAVVNIDNGFGAGYLASYINQMGGRRE